MTAALAVAAAPSTESHHPVAGIAAVAVGALVSTLDTRLGAVGLADVRGGLSLGFDEASWLSTVFGASQLIACLSAAWFSIVIGPRRVLLWTSSVYMIGSLLPEEPSDHSPLMKSLTSEYMVNLACCVCRKRD